MSQPTVGVYTIGQTPRPDLTAERFVPSPFSDDPEDLLYRLGWMLLAWGYLMYLCARAWTGGAAPDEGGA